MAGESGKHCPGLAQVAEEVVFAGAAVAAGAVQGSVGAVASSRYPSAAISSTAAAMQPAVAG